VLHIPVARQRHRIDYAGTALIASAAACLVLLTSLGGTGWRWMSWETWLLAVLAAVLLAAFVRVERRAAEPVLPMGLFRIRTFSLCSVIGFIVGFAMFGAMTYLPTFLQVVHGVSPTMSGVHMLPMVFGMLLTSTLSGQLVSRTGRWKIFPVLGTAVTAAGLLLLHRMNPGSSTTEMSFYFLVFGLGLGLVMQVLVLAVQNAVGYENLGVATSGASFFRSIGASFGVAVFGAVFTGRLGSEIGAVTRGRALPSGITPDSIQRDPRAVGQLPPALREGVLGGYSSAITGVFLYAAPVVLIAFLLSLLIREDRLRTSVQVPDGSETLGAHPVDRSSADEVRRALSRLSTRAGRRDLYAHIAHQAGIELRPVSCWMLLRIRRYGAVQPARLADQTALPDELLLGAVRELEERGLAAREGEQLAATAEGERVAERLATAREASLAELLGDWWTDDRPRDLAELVRELNAEIGGSEEECPRRERRDPPAEAAG
jgi:hypothetical protein